MKAKGKKTFVEKNAANLHKKGAASSQLPLPLPVSVPKYFQ